MTALDLKDLLQGHASRKSVPGAAVAVLQDGEVSSAYAGVADLSTGDPVTADTRFAIGSVTKSMVATAIAGLAAAGRVGLDDPVGGHVPELGNTGWAGTATIRDLLANRSPVPLRAEWEFELDDGGEGALRRCAEVIASREPTPHAWSYSNMGWSLLGRVIETVTGVSWEEAMRQTVLGPAGMDQTVFAWSPVAEPRAVGHKSTASGLVSVEPWTPGVYCAAGSILLSTVTDLLRFADWHLENRSFDVLRNTHAEIFIHGWFDAWCLGWARFDWRGGTLWGWDGVVPGQRTILRLLPGRRAAIALTTNADTGRAMYRSIFPPLLHEWFGLQMPQLRLEPALDAAGDLSRFVGVYAWPDRRCTVRLVGDRLVIDTDGKAVEALPTTDRVFLVDPDDPDNPTVTFGAFDDSGRPQVIYLMLWGLPRRSFTRRK